MPNIFKTTNQGAIWVKEKIPLRLQKKIISILKGHPDGLSEYELLVKLEDDIQGVKNGREDNLQLFQKHFLLMNSLYQLQEIFCQQEVGQQEGLVLTISPLKIKIEKSNSHKQEVAQDFNNELRDYYLNWSNYEITREDVDDLLNQFWRDYARYMQKDEAWEILGLAHGLDLKAITNRYRELAARHHPDRGGDKNTFIKIRAAYESLKNLTK